MGKNLMLGITVCTGKQDQKNGIKARIIWQNIYVMRVSHYIAIVTPQQYLPKFPMN